MNVATVLEEKIVLFIGSAKIPEREGSISPSSFYGQLPDYQSHDFSLIYPVGEFSFKGVKTWGQSKISSCFVFSVNQENQEAGRVQDSYVQPQWQRPSQTELHLESPQISAKELACKNSQRPEPLSVAAMPSVKDPRVTNIVKEIKLEGVWGVLESKTGFQRQSLTKYLRLTLVFT